MPQAAMSITVPLSEKPTGILMDLNAARPIDLVGAVQCRMDQITALLWLLKQHPDLDAGLRVAISGIETAADDTSVMLNSLVERVRA